jgi:hypothetical protein
MKKLITIGKAGFGVFGAFTTIYWAMLNAKYGIIGKVFGQQVLDWVNAKMSLFKDFLPYLAFVIAFGFLVLWFGSWLWETIKKRRQKPIESREGIIAGIKEALDKVKESLDKLNNQK